MRWKRRDGPRWDGRTWETWFAWHPVYCDDAGEVVWLEMVWRCGTEYCGGMCETVMNWKYRVGGAGMPQPRTEG